MMLVELQLDHMIEDSTLPQTAKTKKPCFDHVCASVCEQRSLFLPQCASPALCVSALVDFRRGSCLSAILRQSPDLGG